MDKQPSVVEEVPVEIMQQILQEHLDDDKAIMTEFGTEVMSHEGYGGNTLWRASLAWQRGGEDKSATWIIKRWRPGGLVGKMLGVTQATEALAWRHGIIQTQTLPEGMVTPYIGVYLDEAETDDFLAWLPRADRRLWERNMCDRQALVKAFSPLPQALTHGDLAWNNLGLRWENSKKAVFLIDWELIGLGSPAMDVARLIGLTLDLVGDLSAGTASLPNYYFERYMAQGGTQFNRESWQQAYDLATIFINLWQFPFWAGWTVGEDPAVPEHLWRDVEMIKQKTEHTSALMRKWLD